MRVYLWRARYRFQFVTLLKNGLAMFLAAWAALVLLLRLCSIVRALIGGLMIESWLVPHALVIMPLPRRCRPMCVTPFL